jgi:hypothetical protein
MITHVAIIHKGKTYSLPKPNRHHHIIHQIYLETGETVDDMVQGFLDDGGNFLDREQAMTHAIACQQLLPRPKMRIDEWLYSEDVW